MITLNANLFLGAWTNLIAYVQTAYTMDEGNISPFVNSFEDISVPNGDGKVIRSADVPSVANYSATSSLLTVSAPTVQEQYISVENYKVVPMTINKYLMRGAFVAEDQLAEFTAYLLSSMRTAKTIHLSNAILAEIVGYTPTQATQTVTINLFDTTGLLDPAQLERANTYNAKAIQKAFINVLNDFGFDTTAYNDLALTEVIDASKLKLIIKNSTNTDILVDSLAQLLNSNKITDAQKWGKQFAIPDSKLTGASYDAWLMHDKKIQFGYFYEVATSFFDGSNLNQQDWLHFAYYLDTVDAYPCVCFVLSASLTPAALQ